MKIDREIGSNGEIFDTIRLSHSEETAVDWCHEVLRWRFEENGACYDKAQKGLCEWWLLGVLRYEGKQKMIEMVQNTPFCTGKGMPMRGYA